MPRVLRGRAISAGVAEGEALVTHDPIGFNFNVDPSTGVVLEPGHELEGQSIAGRVLVFPYGKGSTGGSFVIYQLVKNGVGPCAIVNVSTENIIAVGSIMAGLPVVDKLESDPLVSIKSGDFVVVDAIRGTVTIMDDDERRRRADRRGDDDAAHR